MRLIILLTSFYFLLGCSSTPEIETKYYLLHSPFAHHVKATQPALTETEKEDTLLTVNIADYLKQPFLVMQTDTHTLHYSQSHLWAEPLKKELSIALKHELNNIDKLNNFELIFNNNKHHSKSKLIINIEHFHATNKGKVIISGHFQWLNSTEGVSSKHNNNEQRFYIEEALSQDGYTHAVVKMRELLHKLATNITQ